MSPLAIGLLVAIVTVVVLASGIPVAPGESVVERDWRGPVHVVSGGSVDMRAIEYLEDA